MGAELQTNFNVEPYYDDYNEDNQYYRILFRPSVAVQARELTQLQTMMQRQISRFGNSIYKDGSIIEGCAFSVNSRLSQVRFKDSNTSTFDFGLIATYQHTSNSYLLVSNTYGTRAVIFRAFNGSESVLNQGGFDTNRAYLQYIESGNNAGTVVDTFLGNEQQIDVYSPYQAKHGILSSSNYLGSIYKLVSNATVNSLSTGVGVTVGTGVIYQKGFFQKVLPYKILVKEHSTNAAGYQVGFTTEEYIITEATDEGLYDNAIGSYNYAAPGAHRLKLVPLPIAYDTANNQVDVPKDFLPILEFDGGDGRVVQNNRYDQLYSQLGDMMAKRTYEESGNYMVHPFSVDVVPHEANNYAYYYVVGTGIAYIDGYRVQLNSPRKIYAKRAIETEAKENQLATVNMGNYIEVNELAGTFDIQNLEEVGLYSANQQILTLNQEVTSPAGSLVGYANIRALKYVEGTQGTNNALYQVFLSNIRMQPGKNFMRDADSIYVDGAYGKCFADIVKDNKGRVILYDTGLKRLVFNTGHTGVKRLTNNTGVNDTSFVFRNTLTATFSSTVSGVSSATFTIPGPDEFNYGVGYLSDVNSRDLNITWAQDSLSTALISNGIKAGSNTLGANITSTGTPTFAYNLVEGQAVQLDDGVTTTYNTIRTINSANSIFVLGTVPTGTITLKKFYKLGTPVNFDGTGNTVYVDSPTSVTVGVTFDPDTSGYSLNAQIPQLRSAAQPIPKVLRIGSVVQIDCNTHWNGYKGPWNLGFADVYKVTNVHVGDMNGIPYSDLNPDRLQWFNLLNNQKDDSYQISQLQIKPKYKTALSNTSTLLIKFNHFTSNISSTKSGFYSVESYPIDDISISNTSSINTAEIPLYRDTTGSTYDLRNYIDLRPVFANTANLTTDTFYATTNPVNNYSTFVTGSSAGISMEPDENFNYNIEYYLSRIDKINLTKDGTVTIKYGVPSVFPKSPSINKTGIEVAEVTVPPYPSLTSKEAE